MAQTIGEKLSELVRKRAALLQDLEKKKKEKKTVRSREFEEAKKNFFQRKEEFFESVKKISAIWKKSCPRDNFECYETQNKEDIWFSGHVFPDGYPPQTWGANSPGIFVRLLDRKDDQESFRVSITLQKAFNESVDHPQIEVYLEQLTLDYLEKEFLKLLEKVFE